MTDPQTPESRTLHDVRNHLSVIIGYCDLLLAELEPDDPKRSDLGQIRNAATTAMHLLDAATGIR